MPENDVPIRPAATVILLREHRGQIEVLLLHRNREVVFGGDHWVFPGGRIDEEDYRHDDDHEIAARVAAVRETHEEAGLLIEAGTLTAVSHWVTPSWSPKRYDTAFYVTTYQRGEQVIVDGSEIVAHQWLRPRLAIEHYDRGEKKMMPPTIHTLHEIARHDSAMDYIAMCANRRPEVFDD